MDEGFYYHFICELVYFCSPRLQWISRRKVEVRMELDSQMSVETDASSDLQ